MMLIFRERKILRQCDFDAIDHSRTGRMKCRLDTVQPGMAMGSVVPASCDSAAKRLLWKLKYNRRVGGRNIQSSNSGVLTEGRLGDARWLAGWRRSVVRSVVGRCSVADTSWERIWLGSPKRTSLLNVIGGPFASVA